jgi:SMI1 / KNR4 family (SUKH-1)
MYNQAVFRSVSKQKVANDYEALEKGLLNSLPESYKDFLNNYGDAELLANSFTQKLPSGRESGCWASRFFSWEEVISSLDNLKDDVYFSYALSNGQLIPIIETIGSQLVCLVVSTDPNLHGKIYIFDWDFGATYQADSLEEFLGQLRVFEEV